MSRESNEFSEVNRVPTAALVVRERSNVQLVPVLTPQTAMQGLAAFQEFVGSYLVESKDGGDDGGDFGIIPGTKKKTLLKSGSDKLCEIYGLYDEYVDMAVIENWETGLFFYRLRCVLKSRRDDSIVGTGVGSCSSYESKYRYRDSQRKCPGCGKANIRKSNKDDGWYCWVKTGGCGAKFKTGDESIEKQTIGRIENPDIHDAANTVLKMAKKRAKIDAVIGTTRSSGIFTQDMDDMKIPEETTGKDVPKSESTVTFGQKREEKNGFIGEGEKANLKKTFVASLRPNKQNEGERHFAEWLEGRKLDLSKVSQADFYTVRDEASVYAGAL